MLTGESRPGGATSRWGVHKNRQDWIAGPNPSHIHHVGSDEWARMTEACMNASIHAGHNEHTSTKKNHEESIPQAHNAFATHTWSYRRPPRDSLPSFFAMQASLWVLNSSSSLARYRAAARAPPPPGTRPVLAHMAMGLGSRKQPSPRQLAPGMMKSSSVFEHQMAFDGFLYCEGSANMGVRTGGVVGHGGGGDPRNPLLKLRPARGGINLVLPCTLRGCLNSN